MDPEQLDRTVKHQPAKQGELSAAALLFDDTHDRGFKNKARHISPENTYGQRPHTSGGAAARSRSHEGVGGASQTNYVARHRQAHLGDPQDYGQIAFEKRVKDLAKNKQVQSHLSSRVLETWINETLLDASHLDIPGVILKPESKKPLTRYGIDKNQMLLGGIP